MRGVISNAALVVLALAACAEERPLPVRKDGTVSTAFEEEDYRRAESAHPMVRLYCGGVESSAQRLGCLSHVDVEDVCELNTEARRWAWREYVDRHGDDPCW